MTLKTMHFYWCIFSYGIMSTTFADISNDIDVSIRENLPKPVTYFTFPPAEESPPSQEKLQEPRFSYPAAGNLEAYGTNVLANGFYPFKFDLGGLLLGAFVGLGALLLVPKLVHILVPELAAYGHPFGSPYGRNADIVPQGVAQAISQLEKVLSESNVNSSECLQKAVCSYVQSAQAKNERSRFAEEDSHVNGFSISKNLVNFLIDGSKFKSAIENGKQSVGCSVLYPKCPFNQESITTGIKQLILSNITVPDQN